MVQHESRVLGGRKEVLEGRAQTEVTAAVDAEYAIGLRGPVVHDSQEIHNVGCCEEPVDNGHIVVVAADEVVQTAREAPRVVIEARSGDL